MFFLKSASFRFLLSVFRNREHVPRAWRSELEQSCWIYRAKDARTLFFGSARRKESLQALKFSSLSTFARSLSLSQDRVLSAIHSKRAKGNPPDHTFPRRNGDLDAVNKDFFYPFFCESRRQLALAAFKVVSTSTANLLFHQHRAPKREKKDPDTSSRAKLRARRS